MNKPPVDTLLQEELLRRGYVVRQTPLGNETYRQAYTPEGKLVMTSGTFDDYPFMTRTVKRISKDKALSYELAAQHGAIIPRTLQSADLEEAATFMERYGTVIVKPSALGGGKGLTMNVSDKVALEAALALAAHPGVAPLVQEQFDGEEIRVTVIGGVVRSVILRQPPCVTGNGTSTVADLIAQENVARAGLSFPLITYPQLTDAIIDPTLLVSQAVPADGETVRLHTSSMIRLGASFYNATDTTHESFKKIAVELANNLSPSMLIVDFLVKDHTAPAVEGNYVFLEFNTSPSLMVYSALRDGPQQPEIVLHIADLIDSYANAYAR